MKKKYVAPAEETMVLAMESALMGTSEIPVKPDDKVDNISTNRKDIWGNEGAW